MKRFLIQATCILLLTSCVKGPDRDIEKRISVNHPALELFVGDAIIITASPTSEIYTWGSEDVAVATVNSSGEVHAISEGETVITVRNGELQRQIPVKVSVKIPVEEISVNMLSLDMEEQNMVSIKTSLLPENNNEKENNVLIWQSSNPSVVKVTNGEVKAIRRGYATITVMLERNPSIKKEIPVSVFYYSEQLNVVFQKPVTESGFLAGYPGQNAVDGDKTTTAGRWVTGDPTNPPNEHWIVVDLEDLFSISAFRIWRHPSGSENMSQFRLQAWIDNAWQNLVSEDNSPATENPHLFYKEFESVTTDRVRLYFPAYANNRVRLYELEVYSFIKKYE